MKNCKLLSHQYNDVSLADGEALLLCVQCTEDLLCAVTSAGRIVQFTWCQEVRTPRNISSIPLLSFCDDKRSHR